MSKSVVIVLVILALGIIATGIYIIYTNKKKRETSGKSQNHDEDPRPLPQQQGGGRNYNHNAHHHHQHQSPGGQGQIIGEQGRQGYEELKVVKEASEGSFLYDELELATNGFAGENLIGEGGLGYVHKGVLPNGKAIAVKTLKESGPLGIDAFKSESEAIARVHHRHLVLLLGFCIYRGKRMLVYEFVPNSNLEHHLHGKGGYPLSWSRRMQVAIGIAKGLTYLHEDCNPQFVHRNIKAANILIDEDFDAKVADFGLSKVISDNNTHVSTRVMGTLGYLAPEYASSGRLTEKSDVFSFGVMLLEILSGRRPMDLSHALDDTLVDWARPLLNRGLENGNFKESVDAFLEGHYDNQEVARMAACAAASIRHSAKKRPTMRQILLALEGNASEEDLVDAGIPLHNFN